jgi:NAD(P)-dependent dehydrogenase (short-subunit alcohol dehydrogenase family)
MSSLLEGKVAIVTGGARGLGYAIASRFANEGATVVVSDLAGEALESAAAAIGSSASQAAGGTATATVTSVACDVTDEASVQALVNGTVERHGKLDVMVSSAGVAGVAPIVQMSLEEWRRVLSVDLDGVFLCTKHAAAAMAAGGGGNIINIASIKAFGGSPATAHYGAAKAGVVSLSKSAAMEMRQFNVRVNAICPGWVQTDMIDQNRAAFEELLPMTFDEYIAHIQGRLGEPDEIAGVAVFLASDRSRFCSGTAYVVDGGATASLV